jgi:hypothetical protein
MTGKGGQSVHEQEDGMGRGLTAAGVGEGGMELVGHLFEDVGGELLALVVEEEDLDVPFSHRIALFDGRLVLAIERGRLACRSSDARYDARSKAAI